MEPCQDEEGRPVNTGIQRDAIMSISFVVLHRLNGNKAEPQQHGASQPVASYTALALFQRLMSYGKSQTGGNQDQGIHQRQLPRAENLTRTTHRGIRWGNQWPVCGELRPQHSGDPLGPLTAEPRHGKSAHVEKSTEKRRKEHDFGENEPAHPPTEGAIHLGIIQATARLQHYITEPKPHDEKHGGNPRQQQQRAAAMNHGHPGPDRHPPHSQRTQYRPLAVCGYVITATTHASPPASLLTPVCNATVSFSTT